MLHTRTLLPIDDHPPALFAYSLRHAFERSFAMELQTATFWINAFIPTRRCD